MSAKDERTHHTPYGDITTGTLEVNGQRFSYRDYTPMIQQQQRARSGVMDAVALHAANLFQDRRGKVYTFVTVHCHSAQSLTGGDTVYCVRRHIDDGVANPNDKATWKHTVSTVCCTQHDNVKLEKEQIAQHASSEGWERIESSPSVLTL